MFTGVCLLTFRGRGLPTLGRYQLGGGGGGYLPWVGTPSSHPRQVPFPIQGRYPPPYPRQVPPLLSKVGTPFPVQGCYIREFQSNSNV